MRFKQGFMAGAAIRCAAKTGLSNAVGGVAVRANDVKGFGHGTKLGIAGRFARCLDASGRRIFDDFA
jgi:hypothetical protein